MSFVIVVIKSDPKGVDANVDSLFAKVCILMLINADRLCAIVGILNVNVNSSFANVDTLKC